MLTSAEIDGMRTTVASALPDTADISRRAFVTANPDGSVTLSEPDILWSGACRINPKAGVTRESQIGDAQAITTWYIATLPYAASGFRVDDFLVVTSSSYSTELVGVPLRIVEIEVMAWELGRRLTLHSTESGVHRG